MFPSPISLVSSTFLNPPPLTLREFVHGYSSVKFLFLLLRIFKEKKYETKEKIRSIPYIAQRIPLHKELFMKNEVSARREGKGREGRRAKRAMSRRCNRSHAPIRLKRTGCRYRRTGIYDENVRTCGDTRHRTGQQPLVEQGASVLWRADSLTHTFPPPPPPPPVASATAR